MEPMNSLDKPEILASIEFGEPEWQSYLGGAFLGAERSGAISWNWLSDGPAWCVLPPLSLERDYLLRLEAAPFAPYDSTLWEFELRCGARVFARRVIAVEHRETTVTLPMGESSEFAAHPRACVEWRIRKLDEPALSVRLNDLPVAELAYTPRPVVQPHEFLVRHELLSDRNILEFRPSYAIAARDLDERASDQRRLSFRFFRMLVAPAP